MVRIDKAIILAAGRGTRMAPLTDHCPKPLVEVGGRALLDRVIDRLVAAGVEEVVVNVHYMADMVEAHVKRRDDIRVLISDERAALLETGGGVRHALPLLGDEPFFVCNSDAFWIEGPGDPNNLRDMMDAYDRQGADYLMLVSDTDEAVGYTGQGDFNMDASAHLSWRPKEGKGAVMFAGVQIMNAALFVDAPEGAFSNKWIWDHRLIPDGRFIGHRLQGQWLHASSAADVEEINALLAALS